MCSYSNKPKRKRVLFVNGNLNVGGVEMSLINLLSAIDYEKYDVDLLLLQSGSDYDSMLPQEVNLIRINIDDAYGSFFKTVLRLIKQRSWFLIYFRFVLIVSKYISNKFLFALHANRRLRKKYDTAISYRPGACAYMVSYGISAKKKICWWHHGTLNVDISAQELNKSFSNFDKIVCVSEGTSSMLEEAFPAVKGKLVTIPNIVNEKAIREKSEIENPYEDASCFKLITVSRLSPEKNLLWIIEIAKRLREKGLKFVWHIVGDGEMYSLISDSIKESRLTENLILVGNQKNPYPWIKKADLMVHPSKTESFGLVILEAMTLSTPCVAGESIGARELINGNNGILARDITEFIEHIEAFTSHKVNTDSIILNALETVKKYSPKTVIRLVDGLIK